MDEPDTTRATCPHMDTQRSPGESNLLAQNALGASSSTGAPGVPDHQPQGSQPAVACASTEVGDENIPTPGAALREEPHEAVEHMAVDTPDPRPQQAGERESSSLNAATTDLASHMDHVEGHTRHDQQNGKNLDDQLGEGRNHHSSTYAESDKTLTPRFESRSNSVETTIECSPETTPESEETTLTRLKKQRNELIIKEDKFGLNDMESRQLEVLEDRIHKAKSSKKRGVELQADSGDETEHDNEAPSEDEIESHDDDSDYEDSPTDDEMLDEPSKVAKTPGACYATVERPKRKFAKTARQYMAFIYQKEDKKQQLAEEKGRHYKSRKVSFQAVSGTTAARNEPGQMTVHKLNSAQGAEASVVNDRVPTMPAIHASTRKEQFARFKDCIPEGCDLRRTKTQERDLKQAAKIFGYRKVKSVDSCFLLKGMTSRLQPYQLTATAWMVTRELARTSPKGGVLADVPGLGKTVMSLACVAGNPWENADQSEYCKATLVIVPSELTASQWMKEVQVHCDEPIATSVVCYSGKSQHQPRYYGGQWVV